MRPDFMKGVAGALYLADSALGNWRGALEAHRLFKQYSDSLKNDEKSKEPGRIESKYEYENQAEAERQAATEAVRRAEAEAARRNNLQYLSIFAGLLLLGGGVSFLTRFRIPFRVLDAAVFAVLLIVFEFLLVLTDPWIEDYSEGVPRHKPGFNTLIAFAFAPARHWLTHRSRTRLLRQ